MNTEFELFVWVLGLLFTSGGLLGLYLHKVWEYNEIHSLYQKTQTVLTGTARTNGVFHAEE